MRPSPRQIWVLVAGVFLLMTGITLVAPILPLYAREFGVSRTAAGGLISAFAGARLGFDLVGGVAADRVGARRVMVWAALLVTATSVGAALAPNYLVLLVTRVGEGIGSAAFATATMQLIVITTPKDRLGRTMALYQTGLIGGIAVGPVIGGYAAQLGDFSTPFWIYAGLGLLVAALAWFFVAGAAPAGRTFAETYRAAGGLLSSPAFLGLLFVSFSLFIM
ncbi:MAG: MFS transporter, partial [Acidimicrobiia bacterium]